MPCVRDCYPHGRRRRSGSGLSLKPGPRGHAVFKRPPPRRRALAFRKQDEGRGKALPESSIARQRNRRFSDKLGFSQGLNGPNEFILAPVWPRSLVDKVAKRVHEPSRFGYRPGI